MLSPPWGEHKHFILEKSCKKMGFFTKTIVLIIYLKKKPLRPYKKTQLQKRLHSFFPTLLFDDYVLLDKTNPLHENFKMCFKTVNFFILFFFEIHSFSFFFFGWFFYVAKNRNSFSKNIRNVVFNFSRPFIPFFPKKE
jgi:hypothetical protein